MFCRVWENVVLFQIGCTESSGSRCWGGELTFKVYMQEKLSPLKRIFFCISRVSAVLGHAPLKGGGGEEVSTLYRVSH